MKKVILIMCALLLSGCTTMPIIPKLPPMPKQEFTTLTAIPGIVVDIVAVNALWRFEITNKTDKTIKFLLDDSSYVSTEGKVLRLVRGQTKVMHSDTIQPNFPIPPNAKFDEILIPESAASYGGLLGSPYAFYGLGVYGLKVGNFDSKGKFYLVFEIDGQKKTWISEVKFTKIE